MDETGPPIEGTQKVIFHFLKSRFFRVAHVDGVIGSPTPMGHIHMTVFSERPALPQKMEHQIGPDGEIGEPEITGREGFVREMECDLIMTRSVAENMRQWLDERIAELDALQREEN